jgi:hypothetical protein
MPFFRSLSAVLLLACSGWAAPRQHTIALGKWRTVKTLADSGETHEARIRRLLVDERIREYTSGPPHEVTDRLFVIRRAYLVNDALPQDVRNTPQWIWRLDGWISVDRETGRITQLNLPAFDPEMSQASWYRDYVAYCGTLDDGAKAYLVVAQLGKRKPILRKELAGPGCGMPKWEREPSRVDFHRGGRKVQLCGALA